jgi:hypothetical protein
VSDVPFRRCKSKLIRRRKIMIIYSMRNGSPSITLPRNGASKAARDTRGGLLQKVLSGGVNKWSSRSFIHLAPRGTRIMRYLQHVLDEGLRSLGTEQICSNRHLALPLRKPLQLLKCFAIALVHYLNTACKVLRVHLFAYLLF